VTKTVPADGSVAVTVNGNGADDTVNLSAASIAGATVNGDDGDDIIVGSAKVDSIHGDAGNDRLTGFHGSETIAGDDGNDVMIWNNGDGKDVDEGGAGLDETLITTGAAADQMKVSPLAGGRTFFERTNAPFTVDMGTVERLTVTSFSGDDKLETAPGVTLPMTIDAGPGADDISQVKVQDGKVRYDRLNTPFGLNIASSEVLALNTLGGNDTLDVGPGVGALIAITADGGAGNDRLNGGDEADTFFGGLGDDTLEPGAGADTVDGQDGNDTLRVRDGAGDLARGGAGTDSAQADAADVLADVENADVERPAAPDTTATRLQVVFRKISSKLKRGVYTARVRVHCPASEPGGCRGTLSLLTAKPVRIGGVKVQALLASKSYALKTNEFRTLKLKLPKGVRKLSHKGTLSLRVQTVSRDAAGNVATGASKLTVKLVKKAR
jgi:Ca2+-binding RTX toxin-like protein